MTKILVVDDEKSISEVIKYNLEKEGYEVVVATDGKEALETFQSEKPDLILLDQMLPELDGFEVLREIRQTSNLPVIMVTARDDEIDKVLGLELGADDYVTKPFSNRELMSRVKARLRNIGNNLNDIINNNSAGNQSEIIIQDLVINPNSYSVSRDGEEIDLTHREFELLLYLVKHSGQVMTRDSLLNEIWGFDYYGDVRTVDVTVRRLREKIEEDSAHPQIVMTKRGVGYFVKKITNNL
ncbi:MAG: response regulator YycF [Lactobacillaceae bacterium]|jgi:two-component system response regulator VicR|nr:response regulator YycF [Lactobacillaceae bacterium]